MSRKTKQQNLSRRRGSRRRRRGAPLAPQPPLLLASPHLRALLAHVHRDRSVAPLRRMLGERLMPAARPDFLLPPLVTRLAALAGTPRLGARYHGLARLFFFLPFPLRRLFRLPAVEGEDEALPDPDSILPPLAPPTRQALEQRAPDTDSDNPATPRQPSLGGPVARLYSPGALGREIALPVTPQFVAARAGSLIAGFAANIPAPQIGFATGSPLGGAVGRTTRIEQALAVPSPRQAVPPVAQRSIALARRETSHPVWTRLLSAPYAMPLLRQDDLVSADRYSVVREGDGAAPAVGLGGFGREEVETAANTDFRQTPSAPPNQPDWSCPLPSPDPIAADPRPSGAAGDDDIPPELAHIPPLIAKLIVADAKDRRQRARRPALAHPTPRGAAEPEGGVGWTFPARPGNAGASPLSPAGRLISPERGSARSALQRTPLGAPLPPTTRQTRQEATAGAWRSPLTPAGRPEGSPKFGSPARGSPVQQPAIRRPRGTVTEVAAAGDAGSTGSAGQGAGVRDGTEAGGQSRERAKPSDGGGRERDDVAPVDEHSRATSRGRQDERQREAFAVPPVREAEERRPLPSPARVALAMASDLPPAARAIVEDAAHHMGAETAPPAAGDDAAWDVAEPQSELPIWVARVPRPLPVTLRHAGRPVAPTAAPPAISPDAGADAGVRAGVPAAEHLALLLGSVARMSSTRPELALAPLDRPAAPAAPRAGSTATAEEGGEPRRQTEPADIEGLAQQVYGVLRLRLALDRERLGGLS